MITAASPRPCATARWPGSPSLTAAAAQECGERQPRPLAFVSSGPRPAELGRSVWANPIVGRGADRVRCGRFLRRQSNSRLRAAAGVKAIVATQMLGGSASRAGAAGPPSLGGGRAAAEPRYCFASKKQYGRRAGRRPHQERDACVAERFRTAWRSSGSIVCVVQNPPKADCTLNCSVSGDGRHPGSPRQSDG
jgi:hypothetical protein